MCVTNEKKIMSNVSTICGKITKKQRAEKEREREWVCFRETMHVVICVWVGGWMGVGVCIGVYVCVCACV